ncbi:hypothetical protein CCR80_03715 [Rhodothalassium salexigens]|uniref:MFS transporter n=1 Tax=Rhodothalassium salexigens TaxID=1086 RepID=UPI001913F10D|nr:hypothetical protein [Rhodothalassium salexigens]
MTALPDARPDASLDTSLDTSPWATPPSGKARAIALLIAAQVAAMSLWFSAAAVVPELAAAADLTGAQAAWLTSAVSAGFVVGTLVRAGLGLADRLDPRRFFALATLTAAGANLALLMLPPDGAAAVLSRAVIGAASAGIYPVGMRLAASWAGRDAHGRSDTGLLVGLLVGALTLGSAAPYALDLAGGLDWRRTLVTGSALASLGAGLILAVPLGPAFARAPRFHPRDAWAGWRTPALRLANLGYLGHMWELYAMWAWIGAFFAASFAIDPGGPAAAAQAKAATAGVIALGAVGCLLAGWAADRIGRCRVTIAAMTTSGLCAAGIGFLLGGPPWLVLAVGLIWGLAVVADSAQFSAGLIELAPAPLTGTVLTMQTCLGFLLTMATIQAVPLIRDAAGWGPAFAFLALGPALGVIAMARLKRRPEAAALAGGRR